MTALERILSGEAARDYNERPLIRWTRRVRTAYAGLDRDSLAPTRATLAEREVFYARIVSVEQFD